MMDNKRVKTALALLPYREMRELSRALSKQLRERVAPEELAECLSELIDVEPSVEAVVEQDLLASCFNRKRTFTVQPAGQGFKIACDTLEANVLHSNIRCGISELLDQITTYKALE